MNDTKIRRFEIISSYKGQLIEIPKRATGCSAGYKNADGDRTDFSLERRGGFGSTDAGEKKEVFG
jgi:hypothetical protein